MLRIREIITLLKANTAITDNPITMAGSNLAVTDSAEQMPNICTTTGLFFENGLKNTVEFLTFSATVICF